MKATNAQKPNRHDIPIKTYDSALHPSFMMDTTIFSSICRAVLGFLYSISNHNVTVFGLRLEIAQL